MRILISFILGIGLWVTTNAQPNFFDLADRFFEKAVLDGAVDYRALKVSPTQLNELLEYLDRFGPLSVSNDTDKAMLINAYNLFVIKGIIAAYPVKSPSEISRFFEQKNYRLGGTFISLNELEKELLLSQTNDPRLHFVLVCAALGCPKIRDEAYRPEKLDKQLNDATRATLDDPKFIRINAAKETASISQLFEWYEPDFGNVPDFINRYRSAVFPQSYSIDYYPYDWTLNDIDRPTPQVSTTFNSTNLTQFTPSQLLPIGSFEVILFNNLYSQTHVRNRSGESVTFGRRSSILTSTVQFTFGATKSKRMNLGVDAVISGGSIGPSTGSHSFQLFNGAGVTRDVAISLMGPRVKFQPFSFSQYFSIQSSFLLPIASDLEGRSSREVFLALNRYLWRNQFYYDLKITNQLRLFYEFDINYYLRRNEQDVFFQPNFVDLPSNLFVNYFPTEKWAFYLNGQYAPRFGFTTIDKSTRTFGLIQRNVLIGGGVKYQLLPELGLELSYGNFIEGQGLEGFEAGAGETFNFGLRFLK